MILILNVSFVLRFLKICFMWRVSLKFLNMRSSCTAIENTYCRSCNAVHSFLVIISKLVSVVALYKDIIDSIVLPANSIVARSRSTIDEVS